MPNNLVRNRIGKALLISLIPFALSGCGGSSSSGAKSVLKPAKSAAFSLSFQPIHTTEGNTIEDRGVITITRTDSNPGSTVVTLTGASNLIDMSYANPSADSAKDQSPFTVTLGPSDSKKIMIQNIYESDQSRSGTAGSLLQSTDTLSLLSSNSNSQIINNTITLNLKDHSANLVTPGVKDFLTNTRDTGGALYQAKAYSNAELPLSYYDTQDFWEKYVCSIKKNVHTGSPNDCSVVDGYNKTNYSLAPVKGPSGDLQIERIDVHNGSDIYDAATWQIATELLGSVDPTSNNPLYKNQEQLLSKGFAGNDTGTPPNTPPKPNSLRGSTTGDQFTYNGKSALGPNAYFFRMVSMSFISPDPLKGRGFISIDPANPLPSKNPAYQPGTVTWEDWKPITGENAWAFLEGPLQAEYKNSNKLVGFNSPAVQNAIALLPTFIDMQSKTGAVYYITGKTLGNTGSEYASTTTYSTENNISLYAGLVELQTVLNSIKASSLTAPQQTDYNKAVTNLKTLINGNGPSHLGLLSFFENSAWTKDQKTGEGEFNQGGDTSSPGNSSGPKAVDVNTWGIAAIGPEKIDQWHGKGAAYKAWDSVKQWGGFYSNDNHILLGVGYSDQDNQDILSAEWTAGAINAVRVMIHYYSFPAHNKDITPQQMDTLKSDEATMLTGIKQLQFNNYKGDDDYAHVIASRPKNYSDLMKGESHNPYLYASKRYFIPFGWNANPLPSTCSTSWVIMLQKHFNPFVLGGGYPSGSQS